MDNENSQKWEYELISRIKAGDNLAFRNLVEKYKDIALSLACSIVRDQNLAEDILQEVFIKVYKGIHSFKFNSSFPTWLYRIVVNSAYNELKRKKIKLALDDLSPENIMEIAPKGIDLIKVADQKKYILEALDKLRPDEALVLRLFYLCELNIKEIQEITGFRAAKIKVDLHRGRNNLYFYLKQILGDEINHLL